MEVEVPELVGDSPAWRGLLEQLPRVAASGLPVLLLGETGSGKELVARALHALSARRRQPFVAQNCGATPDTLIESELFGHARGAFTGAISDRTGLFEAAEGGTLLLDEIGDASALLQMKLLRVLQEREARRVGDSRARRVDVRVVAATHRVLERGVAQGTFRADLYFRLAAVRLRLPSLRERGRDVLLLARHFLASSASRQGGPTPELAPELAERLLRHAWPGNVRELANACAFAVAVWRCGAPWWLSFLIGQPGRKMVLRGIRVNFGLRCKTMFMAHYLMDTSTLESRTSFLGKVRRKVAAF